MQGEVGDAELVALVRLLQAERPLWETRGSKGMRSPSYSVACCRHWEERECAGTPRVLRSDVTREGLW